MDTNNRITCKILVTSDIHGHIYPTDYRTNEDRQLGLAKVASVIEQERSQSPQLILVDNGDLIQGTPMSAYVVKHSQGIHPTVSVLNELHYDAAVIGNHEFNYGMEKLQEVVDHSNFPWLSAGILDISKQAPVFGKPYIVKMIEDTIKVVILGVTTHYIPNWENPAHIQGLHFRDALETVKEWVPRIVEEEQPDLLVVAYHGGFERDLDSGEPTERLTGENQGYAICKEVEGIDVLITGHQHRLIARQVGDVTVIQPGNTGAGIGKIEVGFVREGDRWRIEHKSAKYMALDEHVPADPKVLALTADVESKTQQWLDQPIGQVIGDMAISNPLDCRLADNSFMEFVNRVQMDAAGVAISNAALLNNESKGFQGTITMRDVLTNFMYPNTLTVLRLTGRDIRAALEQTAQYFVLDHEGKIKVNPTYIEPKPQHYNYDMWEGISYELDIARPTGQRVATLKTLSGQDIQDDSQYEVVMNNYRAGGGGDYEMYKDKPVVREILSDMAELVAEYILKLGTLEATCDQNWKVVAVTE